MCCYIGKNSEELETRYKLSREASERLLADSQQSRASKDEQIKILTTIVASLHLKHILNQKQIELNDVSHLVATQRLVQSLNNQVIGADTKQGELGMENMKLDVSLEKP